MATSVSASEYRANMRRWHERARRGEDVVVTDNGEPTVRVISAEPDAALLRLERAGLLQRASRRKRSGEVVVVRSTGDSAAQVSADRDR